MSDELWRQYADVIAANAELGTLVVDLQARLAEAEHVLKEISVFGRDNIEYGDTCAEMAEAYFNPTALGSPTEPWQRCKSERPS